MVLGLELDVYATAVSAVAVILALYVVYLHRLHDEAVTDHNVLYDGIELVADGKAVAIRGDDGGVHIKLIEEGESDDEAGTDRAVP